MYNILKRAYLYCISFFHCFFEKLEDPRTSFLSADRPVRFCRPGYLSRRTKIPYPLSIFVPIPPLRHKSSMVFIDFTIFIPVSMRCYL
ncbi:hypothetical protein PUN28_007480 [Cardiocondyla obscurior]|uniref:Uncharacterized protein n=1 Tax=Cardiocondyla obscurior TaxID=286306 RepID=A0AAW2G3H1_9HYME